MVDFISSVVAFSCGVILGVILIGYQMDGLTCTQQRAVSDTMPQEFECTQWTKGE